MDVGVSNNTLSCAELNYENGNIKSIHYSDILVKYGAFVSGHTDVIPYITNGDNQFKIDCRR